MACHFAPFDGMGGTVMIAGEARRAPAVVEPLGVALPVQDDIVHRTGAHTLPTFFAPLLVHDKRAVLHQKPVEKTAQQPAVDAWPAAEVQCAVAFVALLHMADVAFYALRRLGFFLLRHLSRVHIHARQSYIRLGHDE